MLEFYVLWAAFVLVSLGYSFRFVWQMNRAARLMKSGDLNEMVVELDRLLSKTGNRRFAQLLRLNKSAALVYLGRWDSALELLESLSKDDFKDKIHQTLYLNNLLYSYLLVGKYREARLLFAQEESLIVPEGKVGDLNLAIFSTLATYRYFFDSPESSRRLYQHLLEKEMDNRPKACILYFLARLDLHEGRTESARRMLETSSVYGSGTYIVEEIKALDMGNQRIGNPGDGSLVSAKV